MSDCRHERLTIFTYRGDGVYQQTTNKRMLEALQCDERPNKKRKKQKGVSSASSLSGNLPPSSTFPAPLFLPGDELCEDPEYPPQSAQDWYDEEDRNDVTSKRKTIYVVPPPAVLASAEVVNSWMVPQLNAKKSTKSAAKSVPCPSIEDVVKYLKAFYHGIPVKLLTDPQLEFTSWNDQGKVEETQSANLESAIGLSTGSELIQIRNRRCFDSIFSRQLNLNDLLDVAISILPEDAYALLMLVNHDLYESDEDDFCCGRAYGGSRVALVSSARYRPELDKKQKQVRLEHAWPASHCSRYISGVDSARKSQSLIGKNDASIALEDGPTSAMSAAVISSNELPLPSSSSQLSQLWLGRVCKTASHELGHCFGIDHCTYYACVMQGTASLAEDSRQPPYLCPVDLCKVLKATGANERERYKSLLRVCRVWQDDRMFAAFAAWIRIRLDFYKSSMS